MQIACSKSHRYRFVYCVISGCNSWLTWAVVSSADSAFSVGGLSLGFSSLSRYRFALLVYRLVRNHERTGSQEPRSAIYNAIRIRKLPPVFGVAWLDFDKPFSAHARDGAIDGLDAAAHELRQLLFRCLRRT